MEPLKVLWSRTRLCPCKLAPKPELQAKKKRAVIAKEMFFESEFDKTFIKHDNNRDETEVYEYGVQSRYLTSEWQCPHEPK